VLRLLRDLASPGRVVVIATHDDRMTPLADRCVNMVSDRDEGDEECTEVTLAAGEMLFEQGSRGHLVYVVTSGEIVLSRVLADRSEKLVRKVGPGGYFGELGPMLGLPRSATARASSPTRLQPFTVRAFRARPPGEPAERGRMAGDVSGDGAA
jgi:putative ABC transport system ATP-binding protein